MAGQQLSGNFDREDRLEKALEELAGVEAFNRAYSSSDQRFNETFGRVLSAVRLLVDEIRELRQEAGSEDDLPTFGGIDPVFDTNDRPQV